MVIDREETSILINGSKWRVQKPACAWQLYLTHLLQSHFPLTTAKKGSALLRTHVISLGLSR